MWLVMFMHEPSSLPFRCRVIPPLKQKVANWGGMQGSRGEPGFVYSPQARIMNKSSALESLLAYSKKKNPSCLPQCVSAFVYHTTNQEPLHTRKELLPRHSNELVWKTTKEYEENIKRQLFLKKKWGSEGAQRKSAAVQHSNFWESALWGDQSFYVSSPNWSSLWCQNAIRIWSTFSRPGRSMRLAF